MPPAPELVHVLHLEVEVAAPRLTRPVAHVFVGVATRQPRSVTFDGFEGR